MYNSTKSYSTSTTTNIFILLLFKYKNTNKCAQQELGGGAPERLWEEAGKKCSI